MSKEVQRIQKTGPPWAGAAHSPWLALHGSHRTPFLKGGEAGDSRLTPQRTPVGERL